MRVLKATILAAIVALPLVSAAGQQPPSSLEPLRRGTVSLSHEATRVTACTAKVEQQKLSCVPTRQAADSSTTLTLKPVAGNDVASKDRREAQQVALPKDGTQVQKLELGVGIWEIEWPGRSEKDRFFVAERDEFAVKLRTEIGACQKAKDECRLKTDRTQLTVNIPQRCRR
ncbi:MAG: hypothetical protein HS104_34895 [Polyangiaceae bacterium]|nr:hypothetical protein [Polyangiaceae bacterium]MCE7891315.1 hypothetical protein [Sorangiineae bacterium PRO1]MCL4752437.1 hypothetical protein [Myxococcales bacterium]